MPHLSQCAGPAFAMGCEYVLITGTHENTSQVINNLYGTSGVVRTDSWHRLAGSYHGSGCTLASAIAAALANGLPIAEGVYEAQEYTWQSLKAGFRPGMGQYLPDRLFWARDETDAERWKQGEMTRPAIDGLYAITPDVADTASLVSDDAAGAGRRSAAGPIPQQDGECRAAPGTGTFTCPSLPRIRRTLHHQRSYLILLLRWTPMACIWDRRMRPSPRRGASWGTERLSGFPVTTDWSMPSKPSVKARIMSHSALFLLPSPNRALRLRPLDLLRHAKQKLRIPIVAIGGITPNNAGELIRQGADAVAVSNALFSARHIPIRQPRNFP